MKRSPTPSSLRCKPGDLALVLGSSEYAGMLVEVLYLAPQHRFELPDGYPHAGVAYGSWVIKILGQKRKAPTLSPDGKQTGWRLCEYGCGRDERLRPLRGEPIEQGEKEDLREPA